MNGPAEMGPALPKARFVTAWTIALRRRMRRIAIHRVVMMAVRLAESAQSRPPRQSVNPHVLTASTVLRTTIAKPFPYAPQNVLMVRLVWQTTTASLLQTLQIVVAAQALRSVSPTVFAKHPLFATLDAILRRSTAPLRTTARTSLRSRPVRKNAARV